MARYKDSILVVDDDEAVCEKIADYLKLKGYAVQTAKTGREAVEKSKNCFFNLAVLDIRLPDMEGTALLSEMSETEPRMKKIMLTGYPSLNNAAESVNRRADAYLMKPVDLKKLLRVIEEKLTEQQADLTMDRKKLVAYIESRDRQKG
jgi:DNA-binding NtrC family response regulator